jgi:hypothetical protein
MMLGLWAMGCGDAIGVNVDEGRMGTLVKILLGGIAGWEHDELGLEYMGVEGSVCTTGNMPI